jgi:hypothetical protein
VSLEQRYRRLLRAYPRSYRQRRGDEMLATLLETARPGQPRPTRTDVADLLAGALRERLGLHAVPGLAGGLRIAGPIGLGLATAFSLSAWAVGARDPWSTGLALAWLVTAAALLAARRVYPATLAVAWLLSVGGGVAHALAARPVESGSGSLAAGPPALPYSLEVVAGLLALLSVLAAAPDRPSTVERAALPAAVAGLVAVAIVLDDAGSAGPAWAGWLWVIPAGLLAAGVVVAAVRRRSDLLWAALLMLLPVPLTMRWGPGTDGLWEPPVGASLRYLTGPAQVGLIGGLIVTAVYLAARPTSTRDGRAAVAAAGSLALGVVGGLSAYLMANVAVNADARPADLLLLGLPLLSALSGPLLPLWLRRPMAVVVAAAVLVMAYTVHTGTVGPPLTAALVVLLVVAAAAPGTSPGGRATLVAVGATIGLAAWVSWVGFGASLTGRSMLAQNFVAPAVVGVVLLPTLGWAGLALVRARGGWLGTAIVFAATLLWAVLLLGPAHDSSAIIATVGVPVLALAAARLLPSARTPRLTAS